MSFDVSNIWGKIKSKNIDFESLKKLIKDNDEKDIEAASIWAGENSYNTELTTKDGFVKSLFDTDSDNAFSKEDLGNIYDIVSSYDDKDTEMSKEELKLLAGMHGDKNTITYDDIVEFITQVEEAKEKEDKKADEKKAENIADSTVLKNDERIKTDDEGNKYVAVEPWDSNATSNNALSRIIVNSYDLNAMNIKYGSDEYKELEKAVMDANPGIYGTEDGGWRKEVGGSGRNNAVIYDNEKIILPQWSKEETKTEETEKSEDTEKAKDTEDTKENEKTKEQEKLYNAEPKTDAPVSSKAVLKEDERIKLDDDNKRYVSVESWDSNTDKNSTLHRIIINNYDLDAMGIKINSSEYRALEKAIMDANPDIYGTSDGGWRKEVGGSGRSSAVLYDNEKLYLPIWDTKTEEKK